VGAVVVLLLLAGCGGGGGRSAALRVRAAADATTATGSARLHTTISGLENDEEQGGSEPQTLDSTMLMDFGSGDASMTSTVPRGHDATAFTAELRRVDGVAYIRFPGGLHPAPMPAERATGPEGPGPAAPEPSWMKLDASDPSIDPQSALSILMGPLSLVGAGVPDPTQWLTAIDRDGDVEEVGSERLGDLATTHYHAEIALLQLLRAVPDDGSRARRRAVADAAGRDATIDVWVDDAARVRQLTASLPLRHGSLTIRTQLSDFGIPVHVEAPRPDQVLDPQALEDAAVPNTA
jgi:hypothetical protein